MADAKSAEEAVAKAIEVGVELIGMSFTVESNKQRGGFKKVGGGLF